jgi:hypothetical protein
MKTLEDVYRQKAFQCREKGDTFGASYWLMRAFEASCLGD